jgi:phosphate starvation-inducible PhoH-like protein
VSKPKQKFFPTEPQHKEAQQAVLKLPTEEIPLKPRNATQRFYFRSCQNINYPYVIGHGPAGGGKTHGPVIAAINALRAGEIQKIIITRPMVGAGGEDLGTLPGGVVEKVAPWCIPILDILKEHYTPAQVASLIEREIIEIAPLALMRGRTLKNAYIIVDEAQNTTPEQMEMMLTRLGEGSRMFITGDEKQHDREYALPGLVDLLRRLERYPNDDFAIHGFRKSDCVRHPAIQNVLNMYAGEPVGMAVAA